MFKVLRSTLAATALLFATSALMAQVATGIYPYGTFDNQGLDVINVGNLNSHFSIPVLNKAGRGSPFYFNLNYDTSFWYQGTVSGSTSWYPYPLFGWYQDAAVLAGWTSSNVTFGTPSKGCVSFTLNNFVYHDRAGASHGVGGQTYVNSCGGGYGLTGTTLDGSGKTLTVPPVTVLGSTTVVSPSGKTTIAPPSTGKTGSETDLNGNQISVDSGGNFYDTTGNIVLVVGGSAPSAHTMTYKDSSGNSQTVSMTYKTYTVQTAFGCSGIGEYGPIANSLVDAITFPDGSAYHFSYEATPGVSANVTGRLAGIELPQGGTIAYTYSGGNNGIICADGSNAGLTRTMTSDSGSAASTLTYTRTAATGHTHTEVVDGLSNHKAYDFVQPSNFYPGISADYFETNRSVYQGAESGTPVIARHTCYNGATSPCTTASFTLPIGQIDTYETVNGIETHGGTSKYNGNGLITESDVYDFGATARGALLRKEAWTYGTGFPGFVTEDDVYDGGSNQIGKTTNIYDGATPVASTGVPQHVAVTGSRGNLTSSTAYASASTAYTFNATYEDTGSILTGTGPLGTTTLGYDSTFVYNTSATPPTPSSGVALGSSASFDTAYTGLPLVSSDPNSQKTKITSYNSMLQPTEEQFPDGGETTWSYTPTSITTDTYQTTSVYGSTETQLDAYGRQSRTVTANGQSTNPYYQQDTCYDANGSVSFVSYQYQGTGLSATKLCSGSGGDIYTYDVLGRLTNISRAGGAETLTYSYAGRATKSTDENSVQRISQNDGLGRLTTVCEIYTGTTVVNSGSPVACGTDIAGTGFATTYAYVLSTGTTTVTQGAQTRTFQTDWLGRTTSVTEPESGTTTYSYAYNSTGFVVTRKKPTANQFSGSVLTTTTTQYDNVGRVVSIAYSDGTPTKTFAYDAPAGSTWTNITQLNPMGRLSVAYVSGAASVYSYDPVGRVQNLDTCLPSATCGSGNHLQVFLYDLAGDLRASTDGGGVTSNYTSTLAFELNTLTSSLNNGENPPGLISSITNGPNGPMSYNLGNGLSASNRYDTLGRFSGTWVCTGSASAYCSGGTQIYGNTVDGQVGIQITGVSDTVLNQSVGFGYDQFNRLSSRAVNSGAVQNFTYTYDRWGNRWSQTVTAGTGPQPSYSFNTSTNQNTSSGFTYDAAGNLRTDGSHTYTYDAEGNITAVDGGTTATYVYDALNHRVRTTVGSAITEFVFNKNGQRASVWNGSTKTVLRDQYYWGSKPVAFTASGAVHFQHQDYLGTERMRTTYNGGVEGSYISLPFGDAYAASGSDIDPYHYAQLDNDSETTTSHAQFRQYSSTQGRWMRPDPYYGSYDARNPQSFNRYLYALNNPLSILDPLGLCPVQAYYEDPDGNPDPNQPVTIDDGKPCQSGGSGSGGAGDSGPGGGGSPGGGGGGGGSTGGGGGGGGGGVTQNNPQQKSSARNKCEDDAQAQFKSTIAGIDIMSDLAWGAGAGAAFVPIAGCVGTALASSELGPEAWLPACRLGAFAATNPTTLAMGAGAGAASAAVVDNVRGYLAEAQLSMRMNACSYIP